MWNYQWPSDDFCRSKPKITYLKYDLDPRFELYLESGADIFVIMKMQFARNLMGHYSALI